MNKTGIIRGNRRERPLLQARATPRPLAQQTRLSSKPAHTLGASIRNYATGPGHEAPRSQGPQSQDELEFLASPARWRRRDEFLFMSDFDFTKRRLSLLEKSAAISSKTGVSPNLVRVIRFDGMIYSELLAKAFRILQKRHPFLCTSMHSVPGLGAYMKFDPNAEVFIDTIRASSNESWKTALEDALGTPFPALETESPPLVKALIVEHATFCELVVTAHKAIADEASLTVFVNELLVQYMAAERGKFDRQVKELYPLQQLDEFLPGEVMGWRGTVDLFKFLGKSLNVLRTKPLSFPLDSSTSPSKTHNACIHRSKTEHDTKFLAARCISEQVTMDTAIQAAFIIAGAKRLFASLPSANLPSAAYTSNGASPYADANQPESSIDAIHVVTHTHVNLRKYFAPAIEPKHLGNFESFIADTWRIPKQADVWDLARHIFLSHRQSVVNGDQFRFLRIAKPLAWLAAKNWLPYRPLFTFSENGVVPSNEMLLQNIGVTDVRMAAASLFPGSFNVSTYLFRRQLRVTATYQAPLFSEATAQAVIDSAMAVLDDALKRPSANRIPRSTRNLLITPDNVSDTI